MVDQKFIDLSKRIFHIPTYSGYEHRLRDEIISICEWNDWAYDVDEYGNLYVNNSNKRKFNTNYYLPCLVAHMDTVHRDQLDLIHRNEHIDFLVANGKIGPGVHPYKGDKTGVGGDDKAGVIIAIHLLKESKRHLRAVFFVSEETGCEGSSNIGKPKLLKRTSYFMQFDAPGNNWVSEISDGVQLYNDEFINDLGPVIDKYELNDAFSDDPFTDVKELKKKFGICCINFFAGYYNMHDVEEYVVLDEMDKACNLGFDVMNELGNTVYRFEDE